MWPVDSLMKIILNLSEKSFTVREIKEKININENTLVFALDKLVKIQVIKPFWLKRWIYIINREFNYSDYLYLSQRIEPKSIVWWETSLSYHGILKKTPQSCQNFYQSGTVDPKYYYFQDFSYSYTWLSSKLFLLWIIKSWSLCLYEAEKALLDCIYIESMKWKKYDDYWIFYSKLNIKKLLNYAKYYPITVQKKLLESVKREFNQDYKVNDTFELDRFDENLFN